MELPGTERLLSIRQHDDGVNAWVMRSVAPAMNLAPMVDSYVDYQERTAGFTTRRELPHGGGVMIVNLGQPIWITGGDGVEIKLDGGQGFVGGAHLKPALSRSMGAQAGIHVFLPLESLRTLLGMPMDRLTDRVMSLDQLFGTSETLPARLAECRTLASRIGCLDAALARRLDEDALDRRQTHALHLLRHRPDLDIMAVADRVGWSRKHLSTRMHDAIGVGPRAFRRLLRFQRVTARLREEPAPNWAGLAAETGYYDQSHMIREFREFAGMTPSQCHGRTLEDGGGLVEA